MEGKEYKDVDRIIVRWPEDSDKEFFSKINVFIIKDGKKPIIKSFEVDKIEEASKFIESVVKEKKASLDPNTDIKLPIMAYFPSDDKVFDDMVINYISRLITNPKTKVAPDVIDEIMDGPVVEEKTKHKKLKKVLALGGATVILAGAAIPLFVQNSNDAEKAKEEEVDVNSLSIQELLERLEDGSLAKKEYSRVLEFCNRFNSITKDANNFYLESDGINHLTISAEEALYTSIVLNNYNADELLQIFGTKTLDYNTIINVYNSVCEKIKIYNMNAKLPSGLDMLMNKPDLFRATEKSVLEFNKNESTEMSDHVILTLKNNFVNYDGIKEVNSATIKMATMPIYGFIEANDKNDEVLKYNGSFNEEGIKSGETATDIVNSVMSDTAYSTNVEKAVKSNIDEYNSKLAVKLSSIKKELVDALRNNGNTSLADKVEKNSDLRDLEDEISREGAEFVPLYEDYIDEYNSLNPARVSANHIISKINEEVLVGSTCNLRIVKANRVKPGQKEKVEKTQTVEEQNVENIIYDDSNDNDYSYYEDTASLEDVVTAIKEEPIVEEQNEEVVDQTEEGHEAARDFVYGGKYEYSGEIDEYFGGKTTNEEELAKRRDAVKAMIPSQIWTAMMMEGKDINPEIDEQIQKVRSEVSAGKDETFINGWDEQINEELENSRSIAEEKVKEIEQMHISNKEQVDNLNNGNDENVVNTYDVIEPDSTMSVSNDYEDSSDYNYEVNYINDQNFYNNNSEGRSVAEDGAGFAEVVDEVETPSFDNYVYTK